MSLEYTISDVKYFNELNNGENFDLATSNFTENLVGNAGDRVKVEFAIEFSWRAISDNSFRINVQQDFIQLETGDFYNEGFDIGDYFQLYVQDTNSPNDLIPIMTGQIDSIINNNKRIEFTFSTGSIPQSRYGEYGENGKANFERLEIRVFSLSVLLDSTIMQSLVHEYGLIENDEQFSNLNYTTEETQAYYIEEIGERIGLIRNPNFKDGEFQGSYNSSIDGTFRARYDENNSNNYQRFIIEHIFIIPYYKDGEITNLENREVTNIFSGENSIKYSCNLKFRLSANNPNREIAIELNDILGSTGWFDESFNGLEPNYEIDSVTYLDLDTLSPVESLQINKRTRVIISIIQKEIELPNSNFFIRAFSSIIPDLDEYTKTQSTFIDNFIYESRFMQYNETIDGGSGIFKRHSTLYNNGTYTITLDIEYDGINLDKISTSRKFLLSIGLNSLMESGTVNLLLDVNNFISNQDVSQLINQVSFDLYKDNQVLNIDTPSNGLLLWNEDNTLSDIIFEIDINEQTVINSVRFFLVSKNKLSNFYFEIDNYEFNLSSVRIINGVQVINIDDIRGYNMSPDNQFNFAKLNLLESNGNIKQYNIQIGQKISWKDWIPNENVINDFYDVSMPNDNLNEKSSNYSEKLDFEIRLLVEVGLTGLNESGELITGFANLFSGVIGVNDYDKEDIGGNKIWTSEIQTRDVDSDELLNKIYGDKQTKFVSIHTRTTPVSDLSEVDYVIHRIETENALPNNILEKYATLELNGSGQVIATTIIESSIIVQGNNYKLSSRING